MYKPINLPKIENNKNKIELFSENTGFEIFTEAVFLNGKETIAPIIDKLKIIRDELLKEIGLQKSTFNTQNKQIFVPKEFWKHQYFKDLENTIQEIFGFRAVMINPWIEKYNHRTDEFESKELNCMVYSHDRYPIDGLVTEKGFYDTTHSCIMEIWISLGLIKVLTPEEILAIILHEFGHNIDPAIVDIKYAETNILSKYLTDREAEMNPVEKKLKNITKYTFMDSILDHMDNNIKKFTFSLQQFFSKDKFINNPTIHNFSLKDLFTSHNKKIQKRMDAIQNQIKNEKNQFNYHLYSEAFADNFVRMYGYAVYLSSSFQKMSKDTDNYVKSRYQKEKERQNIILDITERALSDVHKTDIHRIHALINEYRNDLNDPNIPAEVKKQIQYDINEMMKVLNSYTKDFDSFQNQINKMINEELSKIDGLNDMIENQ